MAVFLELVTEPFLDTFNAQATATKSARRAGVSSARRPLRGLEIKDETYAVLKVVQADGSPLPLFDSGSVGGQGTQYTNFILQSVQEARMEKHQIVETFGDAYIFFFGEAPRFLDVTSILINSFDFNWEAEFWQNYETYFRGSKLTELGARVYLLYDDTIVEGYMLQAQAVKDSNRPLEVTLQFRLFVTNYQNISFIGTDDYPVRAGATASVPEGLQLTDTLSGDQLNQLIAAGTGFSGSFINGQFTADSSLARDVPIRSKVTDNLDEWTGEPPFDPEQANAAQFQFLSEVDDLIQSAIDIVHQYGGDVNDPITLEAMGVLVKFGVSNGIGVGGGLLTSGVSFGVSASVSVNASVSIGLGSSPATKATFSSGVFAGATAGFAGAAQGNLTPATSSPSGFGFSASASFSFSLGGGSGTTSQADVIAAASSQTQALVAQEAASSGASYASSPGFGVGVSISVGGSTSAFSLVSIGGDLDSSGQSDAPLSASVGFST